MILGGKGMQGLMNTAMKISKQKGDTSQPGHTHGGSESKNSQNSAARVAREASRPNGKQPQGAGSLFGSLIKTGGRPQQSNNFTPQTTQELGSELWQGQEMTAQKDAIASSRSEPSNLPKTGGRAEIYQDQTFSPFNQAGRKYKKGDLMDETDQEVSMFKSTNSPGKPISGKRYNVENVSDIQVDKKGQFMTSLGDDEYYGMKKRPTSSKVSSYDQGRNAVRDTLRPITGRKFKRTY